MLWRRKYDPTAGDVTQSCSHPFDQHKLERGDETPPVASINQMMGVSE